VESSKGKRGLRAEYSNSHHHRWANLLAAFAVERTAGHGPWRGLGQPCCTAMPALAQAAGETPMFRRVPTIKESA